MYYENNNWFLQVSMPAETGNPKEQDLNRKAFFFMPKDVKKLSCFIFEQLHHYMSQKLAAPD